MCFMPFIFMKAANSLDTNCGPLLLTSCSGSPFAAKIFLSSQIVFGAPVDVISTTPGHLEYASTMMRNIFPMNGSALARVKLASYRRRFWILLFLRPHTRRSLRASFRYPPNSKFVARRHSLAMYSAVHSIGPWLLL